LRCPSSRFEDDKYVAARNYDRNRIAHPGDDPVTGSRQKSPYQFTENFYSAEIPIHSIFVDPESARSSRVITREMGLNMRWLVHVLVRLAIGATCTSSAAAQVECGKPFHCEQQAGASDVEFIWTGEQGSQAVCRSGPGVAFRLAR
jgi:hypothetical protein